MFVLNNEKTKAPVMVWVDSVESVEESCLEQAYNLSQLPFIYKWVALMPDTHTGMGMPIGGVIATEGVIIPNAVGVDIGCGMGFIGTTLKVADLQAVKIQGGKTVVELMVADIMRNVPVGFAHHQKPQASAALDRAKVELSKYEAQPELVEQIDKGYYQIGTLGGGNHFIELQVDDDGFLGIMVHSGSRNFGKRICDLFSDKAKELNEKWYSAVPVEYKLPFLPVTSEEGQQYINWMNLALDFAYENRAHMLTAVKHIVEKYVSKYTDIEFEYTEEINCHHNYAAIEHHYGKNVWVHRKGATRAREGELAVIPGAMGSYSYVVEGLGNEKSFCSSSHGAGRQFSRTAARSKFTATEVMSDLDEQGVVLGKKDMDDVADESRFAYKDIDVVMENQKELVRAVKRLKTIGVVKG